MLLITIFQKHKDIILTETGKIFENISPKDLIITLFPFLLGYFFVCVVLAFFLDRIKAVYFPLSKPSPWLGGFVAGIGGLSLIAATVPYIHLISPYIIILSLFIGYFIFYLVYHYIRYYFQKKKENKSPE